MIYSLGNTLTKLTWSEMNKLSVCLADSTNNHFRNEEIVDPYFFSELLVEIGQNLIKELENTEASNSQQGDYNND